MSATNFELWMEDLRTTAEPQCCGSLTRFSSRAGDCCVGRACKVAIANGIPIKQRIQYKRVGEGFTQVSYDGSFSLGPDKIATWLELSREQMRQFYIWNDREGLTFKEIAERGSSLYSR